MIAVDLAPERIPPPSGQRSNPLLLLVVLSTYMSCVIKNPNIVFKDQCNNQKCTAQ